MQVLVSCHRVSLSHGVSSERIGGDYGGAAAGHKLSELAVEILGK